MIRLSDEQSRAMTGVIPADTLMFLREIGTPQLIVFRGIRHAFDLRLRPLLDAAAFSVGHVDDGGYSMAVRRGSGHFGYVLAEAAASPWVFCNSSLAQFLACVAASERVWAMEAAKEIAFDARGEFLAREIRAIDAIVFDDENNIWSSLVEELRAGVV